MEKQKRTVLRPERSLFRRSAGLWGSKPRCGRIPPAKVAKPSANKVEVGRRAADEQPMGIVFKTTVAGFSEMEHAFDGAEGVLDAAADLGLDTVTNAALGPSTEKRRSA